MGRLDSSREGSSREARSDLVGEARRIALATGLSEEEWEQALDWARRSPGSGPEVVPLPLLVDAWTFH
jgi:hypothetical protein